MHTRNESPAVEMVRLRPRTNVASEQHENRLRLLPAPDPGPRVWDRRRPRSGLLRWIMRQVMAGLAEYGAAMHPTAEWLCGTSNWSEEREEARPFFDPAEGGRLPRLRPGRLDALVHPIDLDELVLPQGDHPKSRRWSAKIASALVKPLIWIRDEVEVHRMRADLAALDDRCLKDIGISRHEIVYMVRPGRNRC